MWLRLTQKRSTVTIENYTLSVLKYVRHENLLEYICNQLDLGVS